MKRIFLALMLSMMLAGNAPANEVQLIGTEIQDSNYTGYPVSNETDGDFTTFWNSNNATGGWSGVDAGVAVQVTRYRIAPRRADPSIISSPLTGSWYELRIQGGTFQGSSSSSFSGATTYDTFPTSTYTPVALSYEYTERPVTTTAARYWRFAGATGTYGGNEAELRVFALYGTAATARPVPPTISPWGGHYPAGTVTVTMSSLTTTASIYYTTDGSTPSNTNGTLYTGPFTLNIAPSVAGSGGTVVNAVAYDSTLSTPLSELSSALSYGSVGAKFDAYSFYPNENVYDVLTGILLENHAGSIYDNTAVDGYYYWVGFSMNSPTLVNLNGAYDQQFNPGVNLFRSADLVNWTFLSTIIQTPSPYQFLERPSVLYCAASKQFVIWCDACNAGVSQANAALTASASSITGPWTIQNASLNPDGNGFKDCTTFLDPKDGNGYAVYTNGAQSAIVISQLTKSTFLTTNGNTATVVTGPREAPAMFTSGGVYFIINSQPNYYNSSNTSGPSNAELDQRYCTASSPLGTWGSNNALFASDPVGTNYNGQSSFVLPLTGRRGTQFLYGSDYWLYQALYGSRQVILPLTVSGSTVTVSRPGYWNLPAKFPVRMGRPGLSPVGPRLGSPGIGLLDLKTWDRDAILSAQRARFLRLIELRKA